MSQDFADPEIFSDFIVEAKEHLETIEPNLLELEKCPDNLSLLNQIFRPMHSLKGASGFLGLNTINRLAHKAENILDELRKGAIPVTAGMMDVILASTDALRQLIDNLEATGVEGYVEVDSIIVRIEALLAGDIGTPLLAAGPEAEPPADEPAPEPLAAEPEVPEVTAAPTASDEPEPAEEASDSQNQTARNGGDAPSFELIELEPYNLTTFGEGHLNDFLEEALEIVSNMNSSLLELEKDPQAGGELVNDIFRYFHNLKGNSGIIGFKELNGLTHEAETLLNKVRKHEMEASRPMIDMLLSVVDFIENLLNRIEPATGKIIPLDITALVEKLQKVINDGFVETPEIPEPEPEPEAEAPQEDVEAAALMAAPAAPEVSAAPVADEAPVVDPEDIAIFQSTVDQQLDNIQIGLKALSLNCEQRDFIDGLYRSLVTLQNSSGYMGFNEAKQYAERTAKLVDSARKSGISFDAMLDILRQETSILTELIQKEVDAARGAKAEAELVKSTPPAVADKPAAKPAEETPPAPAAPKKEEAPAAKAEPQKPAEPAKPVESKAAEPKPAPEPPKIAPVKAPPTPIRPAPPQPAPPRQEPPAQANAAGPAPEKPKVSSTIRVDHEKLDHLMNLIGELIINRNRFAMLARNLEEGMNVAVTAQHLTETTYAMARISDDLQDTIMKVRMVPVQTVFSRFPRLVRDLSRKSGKQVELITEGEETELDKSVVEVIGDPLVHLIRNSVDHGIESEEDRLRVGKRGEGRVWLRAYHRGNSVAIEIEDDGKGIDPDKMREVAIRKGVITPEEAKALDDREALELIFAPGFSTAEKITDISGRGVGMDVVRTNIKNLKGSVSIFSEVGKGAKFTLSLPLTLAIIDALMVRVAEQTFAIPLDAVSETTKIEARRLTDVNNRKAVTIRGEVLGVIDLRELLEMPALEEEPEILSVLVIHDNDRRLGIVVDRLLERQEVVIKSLGAYLGDLKGLSGATIMGDGSVVLILDPHEIYLMATSKAL